MKTLLYIGNKLSSKNKTITTIETLGLALEGLNYKVLYASSFKNKIIRLLDMIYHVIRHANHTNYVLIDTYSTSNFYFALIISQLCRLFKLKYIPILHGGNLPNRLKNSPKLSTYIFQNAHVNIAPSNFTKVAFESYGVDNVKVIPNSIDLEIYPVVQKNFSEIKLLWVRSFSEIYNPKLAISILNQLKEKGLKASLCMVGPDNDGSLETTKQFAKDLNLDVTFTGKLSKKEWIEISKDYNYFINTTNYDNMPVSVIEAMALGFPIISTNVGGLPFLINSNENGILVSPKNANLFVEAILQIQNDKVLRDELIKNTLNTAKNYNWKNIKSKWQMLLK
tara:strand:+ start:653 stop:1663 length:1011 start_codon:yes stop_codon:yes gene_type:complete